MGGNDRLCGRDLPSSTADEDDVAGAFGTHAREERSHAAEGTVEVDFHLGAHLLFAIEGYARRLEDPL
jgi:hypothetical protein